MPIVADWPPAEPPPELTPEEAARLAWPWLKSKCAPSTWTAFSRSVAVRVPEAKTWTA